MELFAAPIGLIGGAVAGRICHGAIKPKTNTDELIKRAFALKDALERTRVELKISEERNQKLEEEILRQRNALERTRVEL